MTSRPDGVESREESLDAQPSTEELRLREGRLPDDELPTLSNRARRDTDPCLICLVRVPPPVVVGVCEGVGVGVAVLMVGGVTGSGETLSLSLERF